ncbi:MAG: DUF1573 domain-containing protein [Planctomycetota bacterium]|nr:DUF1573 domain-containing protein [Planctomycetota bacterium]MDA1177820.1 DUF1573 domain-containing protein [Planctomycetota bacterium]
MKIVCSAIAGLLVGGLLGLVQAFWMESGGVDLRANVTLSPPAPEDLDPSASAANPAIAPSFSDKPHLLVDHPVHHFGVMPAEATGSHGFLLTNEGGVPLTLEVERTTCKCTGAKVGQSSLAPGESTKVVLEWKTQGFDEEFRHGATLKTNDPTQPTVLLQIEGRITNILRAVPGRLRVDRISVHETQQFDVRVYSYRDQPLSLAEHEWAMPELAPQFQFEARPLGPDELAQEADTRHGYHVVLRILPGLPMGNFSQILRLATNYDDMDMLEIFISGTCISDITLMGAGIQADTQVLNWGVVDGTTGGVREAMAIVRGPHREKIEFEQVASEPPGIFRVEVGEAQPFNQGIVTKVPIKIHIDPGHAPISRLSGNSNADLGRIDLKTNHPDTPTVSIYVRFGIK